MENKHIQLELDLKLAQENLTKAKEEAKGMLGEAFDDCLCLSLASQFNLHCNFADKVREALKKQELDLAEMQKTA